MLKASFSLVIDGEDTVILDCGDSQGNPTIALNYRTRSPTQHEDGVVITNFK